MGDERPYLIFACADTACRYVATYRVLWRIAAGENYSCFFCDDHIKSTEATFYAPAYGFSFRTESVDDYVAWVMEKRLTIPGFQLNDTDTQLFAAARKRALLESDKYIWKR